MERLRSSVAIWNEWRSANPREVPELSSAVLRGAELSLADLNGARLWDADLRRASLGRANLAKADMRGARLGDARLTRADLSGATLIKSSFVNCNFEGASLRGATVDGADFSGADLRFVRGISDWPKFLARVRTDDRTRLPDFKAPDIDNLDPAKQVNWAPQVDVVDPGKIDLQPDDARGDVAEEERRQLGKLVRLLLAELNEALAHSNAVGTADRRNFERLAERVDEAMSADYASEVLVVNGCFNAYSRRLPPDFPEADHQASEMLQNLAAVLRQLNLTYEVFRNFSDRMSNEDFGPLPSPENVRLLEDVASGELAEQVATDRSLEALRVMSDDLAEESVAGDPRVRGRVALLVGTLRNVWSASRTFIIRISDRLESMALQEAAHFQTAPLDRLKKYCELIISVLKIFKSFLRET